MPENASLSAATPSQDVNWRQQLMRCCAAATDGELQAAVQVFAEAASATDVRRPETGLVMVRGRIGGDGAPFNAGEASVTRAVVKLETGAVGYAYLLGRSAERVRLAAIVDALGQVDGHRPMLEDVFVQPVMARVAAERAQKQAETAQTRVDFFTLVRGEDS